MANPSEKNPTIKEFLDKMFDRTTLIEKNLCVSCGGAAGEFRDAISAKEYTISGFCQNCQDEVFGE